MDVGVRLCRAEEVGGLRVQAGEVGRKRGSEVRGRRRISQGRFTAIATLILAPDFRWKSDRIGPYISRFRGRIIACWTYASRVEVMPLGGGAALHAAARYM